MTDPECHLGVYLSSARPCDAARSPCRICELARWNARGLGILVDSVEMLAHIDDAIRQWVTFSVRSNPRALPLGTMVHMDACTGGPMRPCLRPLDRAGFMTVSETVRSPTSVTRRLRSTLGVVTGLFVCRG